MLAEQLWMYPISLSFPFLERVNTYWQVSYGTDAPSSDLQDSYAAEHTACEAGGGL